PSIKPSPESDSIFVSAPPSEDGSDSKKHTVKAGPGTSEPGPGTAVARSRTPELGPGTAPVGPGTLSNQQAAANSNPPPPSPAALIQVALVAVKEIAAPSWAQPILRFLVNRELPTDEILARQVQRRAAAYTI
ncbi:hypothetical protein PSTG_20001, partial [Puccinia striiformis f. sp. tritici PST-78]